MSRDFAGAAAVALGAWGAEGEDAGGPALGFAGAAASFDVVGAWLFRVAAEVAAALGAEGSGVVASADNVGPRSAVDEGAGSRSVLGGGEVDVDAETRAPRVVKTMRPIPTKSMTARNAITKASAPVLRRFPRTSETFIVVVSPPVVASRLGDDARTTYIGFSLGGAGFEWTGAIVHSVWRGSVCAGSASSGIV